MIPALNWFDECFYRTRCAIVFCGAKYFFAFLPLAQILQLTVECSSSKGLRASLLSNYTEVYAGQNA
jgi:hypothetical protein